jgi:hypothetical protein
MPPQSQKSSGFSHLYPTIARWVESYGWIEIGADHDRSSLVRVLDEGGMVWESKEDDTPLDEVLRTLDAFLAQRVREFYN